MNGDRGASERRNEPVLARHQYVAEEFPDRHCIVRNAHGSATECKLRARDRDRLRHHLFCQGRDRVEAEKVCRTTQDCRAHGGPGEAVRVEHRFEGEATIALAGVWRDQPHKHKNRQDGEHRIEHDLVGTRRKLDPRDIHTGARDGEQDDPLLTGNGREKIMKAGGADHVHKSERNHVIEKDQQIYT